MARKTAAQTTAEQIKDQAFSELQALIEESDKLLKDSAALVGEDAETLRAQLGLKLKQASESVATLSLWRVCVSAPSRWLKRPKPISVAIHGRPLPFPQALVW